MTTRPTVSVIIPNRDRLPELRRCLMALQLQTRRDFEVVIVTNHRRDALEAVPGIAHVRHLHFEPANVSAARNAGIAIAAGEIVAFIDDDAVAEPTWLARLTAVFEDPAIGAATGTVIGRNGVSVQWGPSGIDTQGYDQPLVVTGPVEVFGPGGDIAVKTVGTNCAFRRAALAETGGFNEALRFYLDEADVNLRMNGSRWATAYVSGARVNHGFAGSATRRSDRVPHQPVRDWGEQGRVCQTARRRNGSGRGAGGICPPATATA